MDTNSEARRQFLKAAGLISVSTPAAHAVETGFDRKLKTLSENRYAKELALVRNFDSDILELGRILKEVTEVEHSLMLQYLYAGFSVSPRYSGIVGSGTPDSTSLLGIAVQEMQHLGSVNRLMVQLGFSPNLHTQDFPFEYDIYPFAMTLEPLSLTSCAKYAYCESPSLGYNTATGLRREDKVYQDVLGKSLGQDLKINRVGSVYQVIIDLFTETASKINAHIDKEFWIEELRRIMGQGEHDHFIFFRSLVMEEHPVFRENPGLWKSKAGRSPLVCTSAVNPSAFLNQPNTILDPELRKLAWVGNLHYWTALSLLDLYYREQDQDIKGIALTIMMVPLKAIGHLLASRGSGMPFDKLSIGTSPCSGVVNNLSFCVRLLDEAIALSESMGDVLTQVYPVGMEKALRKQLLDKISSVTNMSSAKSAAISWLR